MTEVSDCRQAVWLTPAMAQLQDIQDRQTQNLPLCSDPQKRSLPWPEVSVAQQEQSSSLSLCPYTHLHCQVLSSALSCVRGLPGKIILSAREPCVLCKWRQILLVLIISLVTEQNKAFEANSEMIITSVCKLCWLCLPVPGYFHITHTLPWLKI